VPVVLLVAAVPPCLSSCGHRHPLTQRSFEHRGELEYSSEGRVVAAGHPYGNRYISVVVIKVTEWRDYLDPLRVFAALEERTWVNRCSSQATGTVTTNVATNNTPIEPV
jgi:hypothetical protein